jgi:hypothetical protein
MELRKIIATTICEYLNDNYDIKKKKFNNEITLISYYEDNVYVIIAQHINNSEIARTTFSYSKKLGGWYGNDVFVDKNFRKIGILTAIYDFVEELIGEKLTPSFSLSRNMKKFWANRNLKKSLANRK